MANTDSQLEFQSSVHVSVDGVESPIVFNERTGGKTDSEGGKSFPGGMRPQKANGGQKIVEDVTVKGEFVPATHAQHVEWLKSRAGKGNAGVVENGLDAEGNVWGRVGAWSGKLKSVDPGDYNSSSTDPKMIEIVVECHGIGG